MTINMFAMLSIYLLLLFFFKFLCLRNIKTFLQVCQEVFDVKEYDIFDPIILFELSDFFKVIRTLSILSQTQKLQRLHIPYVY